MAGRSATVVAAFVAILDDLAAVVDSGAGPADIMRAVLERSGYLAELQASTDPQDEVRAENVAEFEAVAAEFTRDAEQAGDGRAPWPTSSSGWPWSPTPTRSPRARTTRAWSP